MKISHIILLLMTSLNLLNKETVKEDQQYLDYHYKINEVEILLTEKKFKEALQHYDQVFQEYNFVFLRDIKIAAQLAFYLKDTDSAFYYMKKGMAAGWKLKDLKKDKFLKPLQEDEAWSQLEQEYQELHDRYLKRIDLPTREKAKEMFKNDQKKAMGALLRIGNKAQISYSERKFAPHSEEQLAELMEMIKMDGYPGERSIGNDYWISTILSHHNSISNAYNKKDTLYGLIKPHLVNAIQQGMMSPYEYAMIDDWYLRTVYDHDMAGYGFLNPPRRTSLDSTNKLRKEIGLRTVETRNQLVDIEEQTGMNLYLPDWINGHIEVED